MRRNITVGIDVGTYKVKVVVCELVNISGKLMPKIIARGLSESKGLRHGYIINHSDVVRSVKEAVAQAQEISKHKIRKAYVSIGGIGLEGKTSSATTLITRADSQITDTDVDRVLKLSEDNASLTNRSIISSIPIEFRVDGSPVLGSPIGLSGNKLEVRTLFITSLKQHLNDLISAIEDADIEVEDIYPSPIASSFVTATKVQKMAGCVLANLGAETVSIVVFENNIPISMEVLPVGSNDITNNIALKMKISLEDAENVKMGGDFERLHVSRKKLDEVITSKLLDIFDLVEAHLKKIGRNELLPAGIILTGGGSGIATIEDIAKSALNLPSKIASLNFGNGSVGEKIKDSTWAVAYGLCILGFSSDGEKETINRQIKKTSNKVLNFLKQFWV